MRNRLSRFFKKDIFLMKLSDQNQDYGNKQYCNNCSYGIPPVIGFLLVIFNL